MTDLVKRRIQVINHSLLLIPERSSATQLARNVDLDCERTTSEAI